MIASKAKLHTSVIKSEDNESFNYLAHANDDVLTIFLYALQGTGAAYKTEVSLEMMESIAQQCEKSAAWVQDMLFCLEPDVLWCIETESSSAKVTWKKKLSNGMKLALGSVSLVEHRSAPSDMLSVCAATLQQEISRANSAQEQCQRLETENRQLREIAEQAVQARQLLEDDLIAKFARLLNEKKSKIRALQEVLDERRAEDLNGVPGSGTSPGAARHPLADPDDPDSDAYDQDTDVDSGGDGGATPPRPEDSLELNCDGLDGAPPMPPKRPAPEPRPSPPPDKRRLAESDDLLDIV